MGVFVDSRARKKPTEHSLVGGGLNAGNAERKTGEAARGGSCHPVECLGNQEPGQNGWGLY